MICAAILVIVHPVRAQHAGDVIVGRSAAGQLRISAPGSNGYVPDENIKLLPPVSNPPGLFNGWSDNNPGFDRLVTSDPGNDFLTLQSGCQVRIEVVQVDPAFLAISASFSIIDDPGERILLGGSTLHTHLTWLVNSDHAMFDPDKVLWRATFKLVDTGSTGYTPSDLFTFYFATTACTRGDCNDDSVIDALDVQAFVDIVLNPMVMSAEERCRADVNQDGYATPDDAAAFVDALLLQ
jgi:hypothetical protein